MVIKWLKGFILNAFRIENFVYVFFFFFLLFLFLSLFLFPHRLQYSIGIISSEPPANCLYIFLHTSNYFSCFCILFIQFSILLLLSSFALSFFFSPLLRLESYSHYTVELRYLLNQNVFVRKFYVFIILYNF